MSYLKQSTAKELIGLALQNAKVNKTFKMKQQRGRCFILIGKKAVASGMDWANAVSDLVNGLAIIKARKTKKKIIVEKPCFPIS